MIASQYLRSDLHVHRLDILKLDIWLLIVRRLCPAIFLATLTALLYFWYYANCQAFIWDIGTHLLPKLQQAFKKIVLSILAVMIHRQIIIDKFLTWNMLAKRKVSERKRHSYL